MVYLRLVFDERVYILSGCSSTYSITEIDNGNANDSALPYPVAVRTLKRKPHGLVISRAETVNHPVVIHYKSYCRRTFDEEKETAYYIIIWR